MKANELRQLIADMQIDFGTAETVDDFRNLTFKHLGPESKLSELRRKAASEGDDR